MHRLNEIRDLGWRISVTTPPALTLHTAAITLWNTVYIERTIEPLNKKESLLMNCWSLILLHCCTKYSLSVGY
jgi:hypothetical protein